MLTSFIFYVNDISKINSIEETSMGKNAVFSGQHGRQKSKKDYLCTAFAAAIGSIAIAAAGILGGAGITNNTPDQINTPPYKGSIAGLVEPEAINAFEQSAARASRTEDPELGNWSAMLLHQERTLKDPAKARAYNNYLAKFAVFKNYPIESKAFFVNFFVTTDITYTSDREQYGVADYWAAPAETILSRKGDCEDFAILQAEVLRHIGVPENRMFIATVNAHGSMTDGPTHSILLLNEAPDGAPPVFFILDDARPLIPADNEAVGKAWEQNGVRDKYVLVDARNQDGFWTTGMKYQAEGVPPPVAQNNNIAKVAAKSGIRMG